MKYCEECASRLRNDAEFCYSCGAPCQDTGDRVLYEERLNAWKRQEKVKARVRRRRMSPGQRIGTVFFLALLIGAMFYVWYSPARRCFTYAMDGETGAAEALYEEKASRNSVEAFFLRWLVPRGASKLYQAWEDDTLTYEDAEERLKALTDLEAPLNHAKKTAEKLERAYQARTAFEAGQASEAAGDLKAAMLSYRLAADNDPDHEEAAKQAASMESAYRTEVLTSVGVPETEAAYRRAVASVEEALTYLPGDEALSTALGTLKQTFSVRIKALTVPAATDYIAKGYYREALQMLERALVYNPQDLDLKTLYTRAVTSYEGFVQQQVTIYLANGDREGALTLLHRVEEDLPEDAVLRRLLDLVED